VWVLPVPSADAQVAVADDLFFAELEAATAPVVIPPALPPLDCPPPPEDDSCFFGLCDHGSAGGQDAAAGSSDASPVDVYREEVVGPYETVLIGSADAGALVAWLGDHGYAVPPAATPIIEHYTDAHSLFVVLRLAPEQGVSAMQPVRVEYPGFMSTFPLEMVTVGAYARLQMTLWIVAEQRYRATNYATGEVDPSALEWDFLAAASNYGDVFRRTVQALGGRAWITQSAGPLDDLYLTSPEAAIARGSIPYPFLTRLQADMLLDYLVDDLQLGTSDGPWVDRYLQAGSYVNDPRTCPDYDGDGEPDTWDDYRARHDHGWFGCGGCATPGGGAGPGGGGATLLSVTAALLLARRRRHRARRPR